MEKDFPRWIKLKEKLHYSNHKPPYFKEREIWWCSVGENVGAEMNGKNLFFRRPLLVIKKLDRYSFLGIPLTGKSKEGSWYVEITHGENKSTAVVSQLRHLDYRRLDKKMATLDETDFDRVVEALVSFIKQK
ncbi:type II toxin-antitoxin system PemK/MazF family toxin [Candidatus Nomurabacteria bacterium]|nr:type II toxin-antitoxin system PemK/MazF family toxin [Candidatus Nomurabacteria bacterium]